MKKYEVYRMAVLIDMMTECTGCSYLTILAGLRGCFVINEQDSGEIETVLEEIEE